MNPKPKVPSLFLIALLLTSYLKLLPLPKVSPAKQTAVVKLVEQVAAAKQKHPAADTSALEREIDQQVYALYALTPEEIKIVEDSAKK